MNENLVNLFILVSEENYNNSIDFILDYVHNSSLCGLDTPSIPQKNKAYYIMLHIKRPGDSEGQTKYTKASKLAILEIS